MGFWVPGTLEHCDFGTLEHWDCGIVGPWACGTLGLRDPGTLELYDHVTLLSLSTPSVGLCIYNKNFFGLALNE